MDNPVNNSAEVEKPGIDKEQPEVDKKEEFESFDGPRMTNIPDAIEGLLKNPPLLPNESREEFDGVFSDFFDPLAPETVPQHWLVYNSAILTWECMRYRRMKIEFITNQRREAVIRLIRKAFIAPSMCAVMDPKMDSRENAERYLSDPSFARLVEDALQKAGYSANAIESEMFAGSLPGLLQFEKLIASAEKRLMAFFRESEKIHGERAARAWAIAEDALDSEVE